MDAGVKAAKAQLRERVRQELKKLTEPARAGYSAQACALLKQQPEWQKAGSVLFFAPLPGELDIWPLLGEALAAGKEVSLPRFDAAAQKYVACAVREPQKQLRTGQFGIREPDVTCGLMSLMQLDFILVPGIAFDLQGRRLGRGKGFYDQLLAAVRGTTCGVAFEQQIVHAVPVEPHDIHLNCILTPTRWVRL